ncbi:MAG: hypothetical protein IPF53_07695 [Blastocatellia bacterium]|nr:hypothetical protein [Blastocatellia bacterium]
MTIAKTIAVLNQMQADGVIDDYAIGGAVGATFYIEPAATLDVDVFVHFETIPGSLLITPKPIFDYLSSKGCRIEGEYVHVEGWPVQFLPPDGPLIEAIDEAVSTEVDGVPTRVLCAEHLVAIALKTGRAKDKARILQFVESGVLDADRLQAILKRHDLLDRWERFERQFFAE